MINRFYHPSLFNFQGINIGTSNLMSMYMRDKIDYADPYQYGRNM